jgi:S1-C subfamily serine protease
LGFEKEVSMVRHRHLIAASLALASIAAGCRHEDQYVRRTRVPGVDGEPADPPSAPEPAGTVKALVVLPAEAGVAGTGAAAVAKFCAEVAASGRVGSVGCLPFVMYDSDHSGPWVPEFGVALADEVAEGLKAGGFTGAALGTVDMGIRLSQVNLEKVSLTSAEAVAASGDRLGVDVAIFGTMKREKDAGAAFLQRIRVDLAAYSFTTGALCARAKFELRSDTKENSRAYALAKNESLWMPGTDWAVPAPEKGLDDELRVVCGVLARRALQGIDVGSLKNAIYIPPADTGRFVRSIAKLRAAQSAFALEYEKRAKEAMKGESPLDIERPLSLNGVEFKTLQAAHAYLATLREKLFAEETARFAGTVSSLMAETLRPQVSPRAVLLDVGFTRASDLQLLEGDLATGGLARSLSAREALKAQNIDIVLAPRIERVGIHFALRVEVYDLRSPNLMSSSSMRIDARYAAELARQLEVDALEPIEDLPTVERNAWEKVNEKVSSGVVALLGKQGEGTIQGSGFVVSAGGLVMTNAHVVGGMAPGSGTAVFPGGQKASFKVVRQDPFWDVALVQVDALPANTHVFQFADPARARVGAEVAVLGNPKGTDGWVLSPGYLSSVKERVRTTGDRPSYMYTCPTRGGNSGSPVLLTDGTVVAVHSAGMIGDVKGQDGYQVVTDKGATVFSELTGFALGAPASEARKIVDGAAR